MINGTSFEYENQRVVNSVKSQKFKTTIDRNAENFEGSLQDIFSCNPINLKFAVVNNYKKNLALITTCQHATL